MAHHQSMIYTSINNVTNNNIFQNRFHSEPLVQATSLLLQEKIPKHVVNGSPIRLRGGSDIILHFHMFHQKRTKNPGSRRVFLVVGFCKKP